MLTVVKAMASSDSGLDVRDRMWLKITIPKAFIGMCYSFMFLFILVPQWLGKFGEACLSALNSCMLSSCKVCYDLEISECIFRRFQCYFIALAVINAVFSHEDFPYESYTQFWV